MGYIATGSVTCVAVIAVIAVYFMYQRMRTHARTAHELNTATRHVAHRMLELGASMEQLSNVSKRAIELPKAPVVVGVAQHV